MATPKRASAGARKVSLSPLLSLRPRQPVDWLFVFKFNSAEEEGNPGAFNETRGIFDVDGLTPPPYQREKDRFSRHYIYASSADPTLQLGKKKNTVGATLTDPLGATFGQVYLARRPPYYVIWNDDFKGDPLTARSAPWGHSKGMLAWDDSGAGFVLQVSTPSWPGAASHAHPRTTDGNTLGWVNDDDIEASQHFFALKLTYDDVLHVLAGLLNSSVRTDPKNPQAVHNGGPPPLQALVKALGRTQKDLDVVNTKLSSGARMISKPSLLHVPPWQLVSAELGGVDLRVASWWSYPKIYSTTGQDPTPVCWGDPALTIRPGAVEIATTGKWESTATNPELDIPLNLEGGPTKNHAKFGVSTSKGQTLTIFGDENQQGTLGGVGRPCKSSQCGRGGLFFVMDDKNLHKSVSLLLTGDSAPTEAPVKKKAKASRRR